MLNWRLCEITWWNFCNLYASSLEIYIFGRKLNAPPRNGASTWNLCTYKKKKKGPLLYDLTWKRPVVVFSTTICVPSTLLLQFASAGTSIEKTLRFFLYKTNNFLLGDLKPRNGILFARLNMPQLLYWSLSPCAGHRLDTTTITYLYYILRPVRSSLQPSIFCLRLEYLWGLLRSNGTQYV